MWPAVEEFELVLLLGSEWSVYWDAVGDSVEAECSVVRAAADRGVPILGVCFGAQLLAHAFGGSVTRTSDPEIGWYDIDSDDPSVVAAGPWLQWHYDVFSVPEGFECSARSAAGPQVMRRERILATQFHPEATETIVARWSAGSGADEVTRLGDSVEALLEETRRNVSRSVVHSDRLVDWFLESVNRTL